jgi:hypothetical protein
MLLTKERGLRCRRSSGDEVLSGGRLAMAMRFRFAVLALALAGAVLGTVLLPTAAQAFAVDHGTLHFGNVGINTTATLGNGVTTDSGYSVQIASGSGLNPPFGFDFGDCGVTDASCTVNSTFSPTSIGSFSGSITLSECPITSGACSALTYHVDGTGVSVFAAGSGNIDFGEVLLNTTATMHVDVTVDAGYALQIASGSGVGSPFSFGFGTCATSGGNCTISESVTPTVAGDFSALVTLSECPITGGACLSTPLHITGKGVTEIVTAVDEPPSAALLVLGLAAACRPRRRRG